MRYGTPRPSPQNPSVRPSPAVAIAPMRYRCGRQPGPFLQESDANMPPSAASNLLPAAPAPARMPYVAAQLLVELGDSQTELTARAVKRIRSSFPVPVEQEVLWADVAFGTRPHGLVLTDVGIFFKDGPADEDEDEDEDLGSTVVRSLRGSVVGTALARWGAPGDADGSHAGSVGGEEEGTGYRYVRWENFDPALVSRRDGKVTVGGEPFLDQPRFRRVANGCIRIVNRRTLMRRSGKKVSRDVLGPDTPIRSVCRKTVAKTFAWCFDDEGFYRFFGTPYGEEAPWFVEVPADQYDAVLQRMRRKIADGWVPGLDDPDAAGALVRRGAFTYLQAVNLAKTGRVPGVAFKPQTGSVVVAGGRGSLGERLGAWIAARSGGTVSSDAAGGSVGGVVGAGVAGDDGTPAAPTDLVAAALADGAARNPADPMGAAKAGAARFVAGNAASAAGYTVGSVGARVLATAAGVTFAPVALAASFVLGNACGKAGAQAVSMAKDLIFEPEERIYARLLDGVFANVVFEHALTDAELAAAGALMAKVDPRMFQALGAALRETDAQERELRAFLEPLCAAVRRM